MEFQCSYILDKIELEQEIVNTLLNIAHNDKVMNVGMLHGEGYNSTPLVHVLVNNLLTSGLNQILLYNTQIESINKDYLSSEAIMADKQIMNMLHQLYDHVNNVSTSVSSKYIVEVIDLLKLHVVTYITSYLPFIMNSQFVMTAYTALKDSIVISGYQKT